MKILSTVFKLSTLLTISISLLACSSEPDPKVEAQKRLEAEAKEIEAKAKARKEFKEKYCKEIDAVECQKLMKDADLTGKGKDLY